jgi:hypothetical protein
MYRIGKRKENRFMADLMDKFLLACIGVCLLAFLGACFYPGISAEIRTEIKEVMQWFGLAVGLGGAAAMMAKKNT